MKTYYIFISLILAVGCYSQPTIAPVEFRPRCQDIEYSSTKMIVRLEAEGKIDSADMVNLDVIRNCGISESSFRYWALKRARKDSIVTNDYDIEFVYRNLLWYKNRIISYQSSQLGVELINYKFNYWAFQKFDSLTYEMAKNIDTVKYRELYLIYTNRFNDFDQLVKRDVGNGVFQKFYKSSIDDANTGGRIFGGLITGIFYPQDNLRKVNNHPFVGFKFGLGSNRFDIAFRINLLFPWSPYNYKVMFEDSLVDASSYAGPQIGVETGFDVVRGLNWRLGVISGAGWSWETAYSVTPRDPNKEIKTKDVSSPDLTLGVSYKYYFSEVGTITLQPEYRFMDTRNSGGTNLKGNAISISIIIGGEGSFTRRIAYKIMK